MTARCPCPATYPDWDGRDVDLAGHPAHVLPIPVFFNMPLGYESYVERQRLEVEQLELKERWPGFVLTRVGFFRGRILRLLEESGSPSRRVTHLEGPFSARGKLHHGGMGTIRDSYLGLQRELLEEGRMPKELYLSYLTCPQCAEEKGGEKILLLRRWVESARLARRRR